MSKKINRKIYRLIMRRQGVKSLPLLLCVNTVEKFKFLQYNDNKVFTTDNNKKGTYSMKGFSIQFEEVNKWTTCKL